MKKTLLFVTVAALMTTGCSKTWSGIKQDSHEILVDTKEVIHNATEPETYVNASGRLVNPINNPSVQVVDSAKVQSAQYTPASINSVQNVQYTRYTILK